VKISRSDIRGMSMPRRTTKKRDAAHVAALRIIAKKDAEAEMDAHIKAECEKIRAEKAEKPEENRNRFL